MTIFFIIKRFIVGVSIICLLVTSASFALTPKEQKGVKVLKAPSLVYESPERFTPFSLEEAPQEIDYRLSILPYPEDKDEGMYVVMPTLGLIAPIVFVPEGTADFSTMSAGGLIDINKYLIDGVMHYPTTGKPWQVGNPVLFGHSNFYLQGEGKYKTIFADIMNLDVGPDDEIWIYDRQDDNSYKLLRFAIEQSYETVPTDVEILLPLGGKELTVFACTNGLEGRWILRGRYIEDDEILIPYAMRKRTYELLLQLQQKSPERRKQIADIVLEKIDSIIQKMPTSDVSYHDKFKKYILEYLERELIEIY